MITSRKDTFTLQFLQIGDAFLVWAAFWLGDLIRVEIKDAFGVPFKFDGGLSAMAWVLYIAVPFTPLVLERFGFYKRIRNKSAQKAAWQLIQGIAIIGLLAIFKETRSSIKLQSYFTKRGEIFANYIYRAC